jgi:ATP-binding cassette subfamily C (CFTR/MRP) protein 1
VGNIYSKTLRLSSSSARQVSGGVASTHMYVLLYSLSQARPIKLSRSVDVERVCLGLETLHEMWAALASIFLAVALLYTQVRIKPLLRAFIAIELSQATWPAFLPLAYTLLLLAVAGYISKGVGAAQQVWLKTTDMRVKFLTSVVQNFLPVKLSHYEDVLAERAKALRAEEMDQARSF